MRTFLFCLMAIVVLQSCKEDIPPPAAAILSSPEDNTACLYVARAGSTAEVSFRWQAAEHTDSYRLEVENTLSNANYSATTTSTIAALVLPRGQAYRWQIVSSSVASAEQAISATRLFYLEAESTAHRVPFPAVAIYPEQDATVSLVQGEVELQWRGLDLDGDIDSFTLYLGTNAEEMNEIDLLQDSTYTIALAVDTTYYWQIVTTDQQGNQSYSLVYRFHTTG